MQSIHKVAIVIVCAAVVLVTLGVFAIFTNEYSRVYITSKYSAALPTTDKEKGTLKTVKKLNTTVGSYTFVYEVTGPDSSNKKVEQSITTKEGIGSITEDLVPGAYNVTETGIPAGFTLTKISCDDVNAVIKLDIKTATLIIKQGQTKTCTFENGLEAPAPAPTPTPAPSTSSS